MIGTTHFTNAIVERRKLAQTAIVRLGLPATTAVARSTTGPTSCALARRLRRPRARRARVRRARALRTGRAGAHRGGAKAPGRWSRGGRRRRGLLAAPGSMELRAAEIIAREAPEMSITLSHHIGRLGLLERENAAAINATPAPARREDGRRLPREPRAARDRGAPVSHAERRHADAGRDRRAVPGSDIRVGADEQHPRRRLPLGARGRARARRRRHHLRCRCTHRRLPARDRRLGLDRRRAYELPDAGHCLDRARGRQRRERGRDRPQERRARDHGAGARLRRRHGHRDRPCRRRRAGAASASRGASPGSMRGSSRPDCNGWIS